MKRSCWMMIQRFVERIDKGHLKLESTVQLVWYCHIMIVVERGRKAMCDNNNNNCSIILTGMWYGGTVTVLKRGAILNDIWWCKCVTALLNIYISWNEYTVLRIQWMWWQRRCWQRRWWPRSWWHRSTDTMCEVQSFATFDRLAVLTLLITVAM